MKKLNSVQKNELLRILDLVNTKEINRMGKLFNTDLNNYFYDTGTGKVIVIDDEIYYIINLWFTLEKTNLKDFLSNKYLKLESLAEILDICLDQNLFAAKKLKTFYSPYNDPKVKDKLDTKFEQLILELTGRCNLRCGYCIYNESFDGNRNFNNEDMTEEVALKAIDYFFEHCDEKMSITFYGGEPLVKFELLKKLIEYSLKKNQEFKKQVRFGFTTNLTLMTKEIAEYLASVPKLNVLCSMDGPEVIHNSYRKYVNGKGTFNEAMNGLQILCEAFKKSEGNGISINAVLTPPYSYDKFDEVHEFFTNLDFLPDNASVRVSYAIEKTIDDDEVYEKQIKNPKYKGSNYNDINPLWKWKTMKIKQQKKINVDDITGEGFGTMLNALSNRQISDKPNDIYHLNACCLPGVRRLYVNTHGEFLPCEKIGVCPDIGNVNDGISYEKIKKYYIDDYAKKSLEGCSNCWAVRLCGYCYAGRYDKNGLKFSEKECIAMRNITERKLSYYHEIIETDKDLMNVINETDIG